jgi:hypothetical protein
VSPSSFWLSTTTAVIGNAVTIAIATTLAASFSGALTVWSFADKISNPLQQMVTILPIGVAFEHTKQACS